MYTPGVLISNTLPLAQSTIIQDVRLIVIGNNQTNGNLSLYSADPKAPSVVLGSKVSGVDV